MNQSTEEAQPLRAVRTDWGSHLQENVERAGQLAERLEKRCLDAIQDLRADLREDIRMLGQQNREQLLSGQQAERERLALEIAGIYDTCRSATVSVLRRGNPRHPQPEEGRIRSFMQIALQIKEVLRTLGIEIRGDEESSFEPACDSAIRTVTVDDPDKHRSVLSTECTGLVLSNTGRVLRKRQAVVALYEEE